ncbi:TPA: DUF1240 domain-containing protein [Citrobacter farmeri]|uniref:hypothetical protein n=1 Tax=Citrobacter farmeri TaxID=67824 RepID=UPI00388D0315|nr:DUF1240 domain-containing protein [Citrobacter farmeri]
MNNNKFIMKEMSLKERMKFIFAGLFTITVLTGGLIFFTKISSVVIVSVFSGADTFYYDFRYVFILLFLPVAGYFDIFALLLLFSPFTFNLANLWYKVINVVWGYCIIAFFIAIPLSIGVSAYIFNDYDSCGQRGPFSGAYYVKDLKMCKQFEYHPEKDKSDE